MDKNKSLSQQKAEAEKEIRQLQNRQKILLNRIRNEERRARNHRLIVHGAILEGVFPAIIDTEGEIVRDFLVEVSHLPGVQELEEKMLETGDKG
ncbi:MAG: DUF3847 domain-containing protein [Oscillospiraceae bacterium]|nr:DUF3847 domain-containing protein [Oscillospiraceae bacterium]